MIADLKLPACWFSIMGKPITCLCYQSRIMLKTTAVTEEWISSFALCWQVQERLRRLCSFFMEEGSSEREVQLFTVNMTVENPFQLSDVSCLELTKSELGAQWRRWEGTTCAGWTLEINSGHSSQFYSRTNVSSRFRSSKLKC